MSNLIISRFRAGVRRRAPFPAAGLILLAALLGGCGQRMAVKVNGDVVSQEQFYQQCANFTQGALLAPPAGMMTLETMIQQQLMSQEARRRNLLPSDAEVSRMLENIRKQYASGPSLDDRLKQYGLSIDSVKDQIRYALMQQKLITQGVTVTDKEVEDFYNQNKQSLFTTPEQVDAFQMTLPTEAAAAKAKQMLDKGAAFELVAQSYSIDQFKTQGGKLPTIQKGSFPPAGISREVFDELFKLPAGKFSSPIKSGNNWVIVKVDKDRPQTSRTLADVKDEIRQQLLMQKAQQGGQYQRFQQRMMELRRDADIQVGLDQFKDPVMAEQQKLKQQPAPGVTPMLPGGK